CARVFYGYDDGYFDYW
nr:immunoglobulin heavy chain junction region [Mus musculus]MBK4185159.1 immunoglobulin heavy chain junction region [Mus musculus]